jgi:hypothetical protein
VVHQDRDLAELVRADLGRVDRGLGGDVVLDLVLVGPVRVGLLGALGVGFLGALRVVRLRGGRILVGLGPVAAGSQDEREGGRDGGGSAESTVVAHGSPRRDRSGERSVRVRPTRRTVPSRRPAVGRAPR